MSLFSLCNDVLNTLLREHFVSTSDCQATRLRVVFHRKRPLKGSLAPFVGKMGR